MNKRIKIKVALVPAALMLAVMQGDEALAVDLRQAIQSALNTSPEINQAVANREATEEERRQARGLYGPRISVEGSAGIRRLENPTRRALGIANDTLYPLEADLFAEQVLVDFGRNRAELSRQAARTDAAAYRVEERAEFTALNVSRSYFDYLLQERIVAASQDNLTFHERLVNDLREGVTRGSISIADQQQAEERLQAARVRLTEANEERENAAIAFHRLAGVPIGDATMPPPVASRLPGNLDSAVDQARASDPRVLEALADFDTANYEVNAARAELAPRISAEGRARIGDDIDGFQGETQDYLARVVLRWTIFSSGINQAAVREAQARARERRFRVDEVARIAEADIRTAWNRLESQTQLVGELEQQSRSADDLLLSYREQFNVGRRSLLDVLDSQNTRFNAQVRTETARMAQLYAQYRVLAASNQLLDALEIPHPDGARANNRERFRVRASTAAEVLPPRNPYGPTAN
ncbi:MAG TPA: TolC family outer membrane protein [Allosphingosinicella sp.]|nr:TolC family outer membrane protein [Allosphingosinicella sp.]